MFPKGIVLFAVIAFSSANVFAPMPYAAAPVTYSASSVPLAAASVPYGAASVPYAAASVPFTAASVPYSAASVPYSAASMPYSAASMPYSAASVPYSAASFMFPQAAIDYYALPKLENYNYVLPDKAPTEQSATSETRESEVVKGTYSLQENDGSVRSVHYTSDDKNGFSAIVSRSNQGINPQSFAKSLLNAPSDTATHNGRIGVGFPTYRQY